MAEGPTSHAATANCPMLCVIPPATLTPKVEMCKWVLFFQQIHNNKTKYASGEAV